MPLKQGRVPIRQKGGRHTHPQLELGDLEGRGDLKQMEGRMQVTFVKAATPVKCDEENVGTVVWVEEEEEEEEGELI